MSNPLVPISSNVALMASMSEQELCEALGNILETMYLSNADIKQFGDACKDLPQVDMQVQETLHAGMYTRSITIPAGTIATGLEVLVDTVSIILGDITVRGEEGIKRYTGFHVLPTSAGKRRIGVAHSDTYWATVFPTSSTNLDAAYYEMTGEHRECNLHSSGCGGSD